MADPSENEKKEESKYEVIENLFLYKYQWKVMGMEQLTYV